LIGPDTVNTMPLATLNAAAEHGSVGNPGCDADPTEDLRALAGAGIDMDDVTDQLLTDGIALFEGSLDKLIAGIESKRHEPFRDRKKVSLSEAYDRPVWGDEMRPYEAMRDRLRVGESRYVHLDAAQLVKHAFGLVTESKRQGKRAVLVYLYEEPKKNRSEAKIKLHREEVASFAKAIAGAAVGFVSIRWRDWLDRWSDSPSEAVRAHGGQVRRRFDLH